VSFDAQFGIIQGLAGFEIKFPLVPGAFEDLAFAFVAQLLLLGKDNQWTQATFAERPAAVWTEIAQRVKIARDVEDADFATRDPHDFAAARWQFLPRGNDMAVGGWFH